MDVKGLVVAIILVLVFLGLGISLNNITGNYITNPSKYCYDNDHGKVYGEKGIVTNEFNREYIDFCDSRTVLTEYYCEGDIVRSRQRICESGTCYDGACA